MNPRTSDVDDQNYLLRGIDPTRWNRFKARAESEGIAMRTLLLLLADAYADGAIVLRAQPTAAPTPTPKRKRR